jgi:hypothetical protein
VAFAEVGQENGFLVAVGFTASSEADAANCAQEGIGDAFGYAGFVFVPSAPCLGVTRSSRGLTEWAEDWFRSTKPMPPPPEYTPQSREPLTSRYRQFLELPFRDLSDPVEILPSDGSLQELRVAAALAVHES